MKKWKKFETKTHQLLQVLNPKAEVVSNVFLTGKLSKGRRQVDVKLVEPGQYDFIAFECKDYKKPLDIPIVESFNTKLQDLGAKKGAIVSNSPFTKGAENMARELGIDLLGLVDTGDSDIRTKLYASMLISDTIAKSISVKISTSASFRGGIPANPREMKFIVGNSTSIASTFKIFANLWNNTNLLTKTPGVYQHIVPNSQIVTILNEYVPLGELQFTYEVIERHFIGNIEIIEAKGIYNFREHSFQTRSIKTEVINAYEEEKIWKEISPDEVKNTKTTFGLSCTSLFPEDTD